METEEMIVLEGLEAALAENVRLQREKPGHVVLTHLDTLRFDENHQAHPIDPNEECEYVLAGVPVASCLFEHESGGECFVGTLDDGKPHLMLEFAYLTEEEEEQFNALGCSAMFRLDQCGAERYHVIDCGDDVRLAAHLWAEVAVKVYGARVAVLDKWFTAMKKKTEAAQEARDGSVRYRKQRRGGIFRFFREVKAGLKGAFPELFG